MTEAEKTYILAFRQGTPEPENWQSRITTSPGITLIANTGRYLRVRCTEKDIQSATAPFGPSLMIEEEMPRYL